MEIMTIQKVNYSINKDYLNSQKERELKSLNDKIGRLKNELDNNRKKYNQEINELNEKLKQKEKENKKLNILNDSKCICNTNDGRIKSYSQDKKNYTQRYITNTIYKEIRDAKKFDNSEHKDKNSYLNECLREKEEELNYLKACLDQKEKELEIYVDKNKKTKIIMSNRKANNIKINDIKEKELYEQISIYEKEIECKNKEITILRKRILTLVIYLKRKDKNILILDNELKIVEKENEEMRVDNDALTIKNKTLEKINDNLLNKKKCTCDVGLERYNIAFEQQKTDAEKLRNRFNGLFKELSEYRKKNVELNKEFTRGISCFI